MEDQQQVDAPETPQTPPPGDDLQKVYDAVHSRGLYTKSYDEFKTKYSSPDQVSKLYDVVSKEGLYTKSKDEFVGKYFPQTQGTPRQQAKVTANTYLDSEVKNNGADAVDAMNEIAHKHAFTTGRQDLVRGQDATYQHVITPKILPDQLKEQRDAVMNNLTPESINHITEQIARNDPSKRGAIEKANYLKFRGDEGDDEQVMANADQVGKQELRFNIPKQRLEKPLDVIESIAHGYNERTQAIKDYNFLKSASESQVMQLYFDRKNQQHPDNPVPVAGGFASSIGSEGPVLGAALGAGIIAGPEAAFTISAPEMRDRAFTGKFWQTLDEEKAKGTDDHTAIQKAIDNGTYSEKVALVTGAAMSAGGGKVLESLTPEATSVVKNALSKASSFTKTSLEEAAKVGVISGAGQSAENVHEGKDTMKGVYEAAEGGFLNQAAIGLLIAGVHKGLELSQKNKNVIKQSLIKLPPEVIDQNLKEMNVTPEQAAEVKTQLEEHKELDKKIPENVDDDESRLAIQGRLKRKAELEEELKGLDKVFQPPVKEKIEAVDQQITDLAEEGRQKARARKVKEKAEYKAKAVEAENTNVPENQPISSDANDYSPKELEMMRRENPDEEKSYIPEKLKTETVKPGEAMLVKDVPLADIKLDPAVRSKVEAHIEDGNNSTKSGEPIALKYNSDGSLDVMDGAHRLIQAEKNGDKNIDARVMNVEQDHETFTPKEAPPAGKSEPVEYRKPEEVDRIMSQELPKEHKKTVVKVKYLDPETGKEVTEEASAREAFVKMKRQHKILDKVLKCL